MRAYVSAAFCSINTVICYPSAQIEGVVVPQARRAVSFVTLGPTWRVRGGARRIGLPPDLRGPPLTP